jgi:hypothetical protein
MCLIFCKFVKICLFKKVTAQTVLFVFWNTTYMYTLLHM